MLAACAAGLATCWVGLSQGWLATAEGKAALGLPAACLPIAPIIVGRPKSSPAPVPRKEPRLAWVPDPLGTRCSSRHDAALARSYCSPLRT
jgi:hypothetical protein